MAWTYDSSDLVTTTASGRRNVVRLRIGDTDTTDQQLDDAEIEYYLSAASDKVLPASLACCRALAAKYARQVNTRMGDLSLGAAVRADHYNSMAEEIRKEIQTRLVVLTRADTTAEKDALKDDTSLVQPSFRIGQDDYNGPSDSNKFE